MSPERDVKIRYAETGDAQALTQLARKTFVDTFGRLYSNENLNRFMDLHYTADRFRDVINDPGAYVNVAEAAGQGLIGYVTAGACDLPIPSGAGGGQQATHEPQRDREGRAGEIKKLYLDRDIQSGGVGGRLMDEAMPWLCARFDRIFLSVYKYNYGAQRFYRRRGFEIIKAYKFMVGDHSDPEFIMQHRP
ncbi:MAG: GNAT family N-acetyltransferase [Pseudomonadota bacterium]